MPDHITDLQIKTQPRLIQSRHQFANATRAIANTPADQVSLKKNITCTLKSPLKIFWSKTITKIRYN